MADSSQITLLLVGHPEAGIGGRVKLTGRPAVEADGFNTVEVADDGPLRQVIADARPQVIFSFGDLQRFPSLMAMPLEVRRRWLHFDESPPPGDLAESALATYVDVATNDRFPDTPLVSVFTPTYRTGDRLRRPFQSLLDQHYTNWEWVVYDDSPDDETFEALRAIAAEEPRVRIFRGDRNCGVIGEVKRRLCGLARGSILVELDHDDELTDHCLFDLVQAFNHHPEAGFAYTDCAEVFEDGELAGYGPGWGFGFGSYRSETYRGKVYRVTNYPSINAKTIRHIVGVPNHVRAWRREAYERLGGYRPEIHVADDYEILIRTFLTTRMIHVRRFGYIQYLQRDGGNTQRRRNREIQRLVSAFRSRYEDEIHARFAELGVEDWVRDGDRLDWSRPAPEPTPVANLVFE